MTITQADIVRVGLDTRDFPNWNVRSRNLDVLSDLDQARAQKDAVAERIWTAVHQASTPHLKEDGSNGPYGFATSIREVLFSPEGTLPKQTIQDLVDLIPHVGHLGLKARMGDVAFHAAEKTDKKLTIPGVRDAVHAYVDFAQTQLGDLRKHSNAADALARAWELCLSVLGKEEALRTLVLDQVKQVASDRNIHPTTRLILLRNDRFSLDPADRAKWATQAAEQAEKGDYPNDNPNFTSKSEFPAVPLPLVATQLHDIAAKAHQKNKDDASAQAATMESMRVETDRARAMVEAGNPIGGGYNLLVAMQRRMQLMGREEQGVIDLHREAIAAFLLGKEQGVGVAEDITDLVQSARPAVETWITGADLREDMMRLVAVNSFLDKTTLDQQVQTGIQKTGLTQLFGSVEFTDTRITAQAESGSPEKLAHDRTNYQNNVRQVLVSAWLEPLRKRLFDLHQPTADDLATALAGAPLMHTDDLKSVIFGFCYALQGDNLVASHLLVPHLETVFRRVLHQDGGVVPTGVNSDGTEDVRMLGPLLETPYYRNRLDAYFGQDYMYEVECFFNRTPGPNLRNALCHGFGKDELYDGWPGVIATHLVMQAYLALPPQQS